MYFPTRLMRLNFLTTVHPHCTATEPLVYLINMNLWLYDSALLMFFYICHRSFLDFTRTANTVAFAGGLKHVQMSQFMRLWYFSHRRLAKAQASLPIRAVSLEPSLFAHMKYSSRWRVGQKLRHLGHWMAVHARLKNEFMEDEMCHNLIRWLKWASLLYWYFCRTLSRMPMNRLNQTESAVFKLWML